MTKFTINGREVSENEFWTQNNSTVPSFDVIYFAAPQKANPREGMSTRHKAAGIKSVTDELNKSKKDSPVKTEVTRMASDSDWKEESPNIYIRTKPKGNSFLAIKDYYLYYFNNDSWAFNKILEAKDEVGLEIAIKQITGRTVQEQEVFKQFDVKVKEYVNLDKKGVDDMVRALTYTDEDIDSFSHLLEFYSKIVTEDLERIVKEDIHENKRNAINHTLKLRREKAAKELKQDELYLPGIQKDPKDLASTKLNYGGTIPKSNGVLEVQSLDEVDVRHFKFTDPKGKKESNGKLFYEFDWEFIEAAAKRMQENKGDKYERYNWHKKIDIEELKQAINRHHIEVMKGNYKDGEDELGHIVSYMTNAMMLYYQLKNY